MLTALGVGGLAVALALQDTLGNLFAGIQVLASGKIRPGDYMQPRLYHEGYVTDITFVIPLSKLCQILSLSSQI